MSWLVRGRLRRGEEEVLKHVELHAREAHGEDPAQWSEEEAQMVKDLIRPYA